MARELSAPPANPEPWTFRSKSTRSTATVQSVESGHTQEVVTITRDTVTVNSRTWFAARAEACLKLGVHPEDLELVKGPING